MDCAMIGDQKERYKVTTELECLPNSYSPKLDSRNSWEYGLPMFINPQLSTDLSPVRALIIVVMIFVTFTDARADRGGWSQADRTELPRRRRNVRGVINPSRKHRLIRNSESRNLWAFYSSNRHSLIAYLVWGNCNRVFMWSRLNAATWYRYGQVVRNWKAR
jgi:hypothetical protein